MATTHRVNLPLGLYPNDVGEAMVDQMLPITDRYGDPDSAMLIYLMGLGWMLAEVNDLAKSGPNGEPGWSQLFDLNRAKTDWLPWIGQLVGYRVPPRPDGLSLVELQEYDATQRERIVSRSSHRRGGVDILREVVQEHLSDPKTVIIQQRYGGNAAHIHVWVYADQIATSAAEVEAAARAQKAAGLIMTFNILDGSQNYAALNANSASYAIVKSKFAHYSEVLSNPSKP
jgi:hypothetical protein